MKVVFAVLVVIGSMAFSSLAQQKLTQIEAPYLRSSPAYAEVLLRKTELASELETLLADFTEDYPKVKNARFAIDSLQKQIEKLRAVKSADAGKLTLALGKLIVRRVELETDVFSLRQSYADEHPDVKRAKKRLEAFDRAIAEILN